MLKGKKTIILGVLYALLSAYTGITGNAIPGFVPDPDWLANSIAALMAVTAKVGLSATMQSVLRLLVESTAPRIVNEIKKRIDT